MSLPSFRHEAKDKPEVFFILIPAHYGLGGSGGGGGRIGLGGNGGPGGCGNATPWPLCRWYFFPL